MRAVLYILPYNYPLQTTVLRIARALAAGSSIVLKPPPKTPLTATILTDVITTAADLPTDAFNFLPGRGIEIGDSRVDTITMSGLSGGGVHVTRESGMANLVMELGDNAPAIRFRRCRSRGGRQRLNGRSVQLRRLAVFGRRARVGP